MVGRPAARGDRPSAPGRRDRAGAGCADDLEAFRAPGIGSTRRELQRAVRVGVEVEKDTTGRLVPLFHEIYRAWVERWIPRSGLPHMVARRTAMRQEPYAKFATVAARTGDACRMFLAWYHGRPVAATIMLVHGQHAVAWRSYSIAELPTPVCAHLLTQVTAIEDAVRSGCRSIDLGQWGGAGDPQREENLLGAVPRSVVDLRIEPAGLARLRAARTGPRACWYAPLPGLRAVPPLGQPSLSRSAPRAAVAARGSRRRRPGLRPDGRPASPPRSASDSPRPRGSVYLCASVPAGTTSAGPAPIAQ